MPGKTQLYLSLAINVITIASIAFSRQLLPPVVPLFYGQPEGQMQLIATWGLLLAPGLAILIMIVNTILTTLIKDEFLKKVLMFSSLFVSLLSAITVLKIIFLVGFF